MKAFLKKLTSRKFLMALSGAVCGILTLFIGRTDTVTTVAGALVTLLSTLGYCITEGVLDAKSVSTMIEAARDAAAALTAQGVDADAIDATDTLGEGDPTADA